jgi:hypothetical protein
VSTCPNRRGCQRRANPDPRRRPLSVRSLKRLTAAGTLRCYVVGGKVLRLKASDVEALIVPADQCRNW